MNTVILLACLIALVYTASAWHRRGALSAGDVIKADVDHVKQWTRSGTLSAEDAGLDLSLFAVKGRTVHQPTVASPLRRPAPRRRGPAVVGDQTTGTGRRRNPNAPCWICGSPMGAGHKHD